MDPLGSSPRLVNRASYSGFTTVLGMLNANSLSLYQAPVFASLALVSSNQIAMQVRPAGSSLCWQAGVKHALLTPAFSICPACAEPVGTHALVALSLFTTGQQQRNDARHVEEQRVRRHVEKQRAWAVGSWDAPTPVSSPTQVQWACSDCVDLVRRTHLCRYNTTAASQFLDVSRLVLDSPNTALDLRIANAPQYKQARRGAI